MDDVYYDSVLERGTGPLVHATYIAPFTRHISRTDPLFQVEWVKDDRLAGEILLLPRAVG